MVRTLNLAVSLVGLSLLIVLLCGGLGALMGFGYFGESLVGRYPWLESTWTAIWIFWTIGWLFGVSMFVFNFRPLIQRVAQRKFEEWALSDVPLALGHIAIVTAFASITFPPPWNDSFYFGLMWAGFFYALGVGLFALSSRKAAGSSSVSPNAL